MNPIIRKVLEESLNEEQRKAFIEYASVDLGRLSSMSADELGAMCFTLILFIQEAELHNKYLNGSIPGGPVGQSVIENIASFLLEEKGLSRFKQILAAKMEAINKVKDKIGHGNSTKENKETNIVGALINKLTEGGREIDSEELAEKAEEALGAIRNILEAAGAPKKHEPEEEHGVEQVDLEECEDDEDLEPEDDEEDDD